jgi:hypothetical protein
MVTSRQHMGPRARGAAHADFRFVACRNRIHAQPRAPSVAAAAVERNPPSFGA